MFGAVRDMAAGYGRDPDAIELVVRANASITSRSLDGDRPAYHGSIEQVADDLDATRRVGAHEIIVDLQGSAEHRRRTPRAGDGRDVSRCSPSV